MGPEACTARTSYNQEQKEAIGKNGHKIFTLKVEILGLHVQ
jgi:hypothetical protein